MPRPKSQHLKRQKDGYFYARYLDKQFKAKTEKEAFAKAKAYKEQLERGAIIQSNQTVGEYVSYWLPIHKASVKASTYNSYVSILTTAIEPIDDIQLSAVTTDHISEAFSSLKDKSASYIHKAKVLLTEIFDSAVDAGYLLRNPVRAQSVKPPKGKRGSHRAITKSERSVIEKTQHKMQLAAMLMLYCGLRRGELLGLQAQDIAGEELTIRRAVYYISNQPQISEPKTANGIRTVPSPDFILKLLPKMNRDCYVLTGTKKPMTEQVFTRAWSNYNKALGIKVRCHDLRHSYCTWLRDSGVDMHQAIIWMGHADEKLILRIYDHPGSERENNAKNLLFSSLKLRKELPKENDTPQSVEIQGVTESE